MAALPARSQIVVEAHQPDREPSSALDLLRGGITRLEDAGHGNVMHLSPTAGIARTGDRLLRRVSRRRSRPKHGFERSADMTNLFKHSAPPNFESPATADLLVFPCPPAAPAAPARKRRYGPNASADSARIYRFRDHLTPAECAILAAWINDPSHGYERLHVERCIPGAAAWASFALVYVANEAWSVWGLARRMGEVEVWRCATGETVGLHQTMPAALAELPHASEHRRSGGQSPQPGVHAADRSGVG